MKKDIDRMWVELIEAILEENDFYDLFKSWLNEHGVALGDAARQLHQLMLDDISLYRFLDSFEDVLERAKAANKEFPVTSRGPVLDLFTYIDERGLWLNYD